MVTFLPSALDRRARSGAVVVVAATLVCALAGCGGSSDQTAAAAPAEGGGGPRGLDPAVQQQVTQCLTAAGVPVPTFAARPSGETRPPRPTDATGAPAADGERRGDGAYADPKVQAALKACGITLPTRGPRPSGATPTPAP